jgi:ribonuclease T2
MQIERIRRAAMAAAVAGSFIFLFVVVSFAQQNDPRQNAPGKFDFYVLALSWSPSYCADLKQRAPDRPPGLQCGGRPFAFVVHGLWPEYEKGYPSYCEVPAQRLTHAIVSGMLELMPSPHLIFHEWQRHGTCSGLSPNAYFEAVRKARAVVKIPPAYLDPAAPATVSPEAVAQAFIKANAGLTPGAMAVACNRTRLTEVRLCLSKDLAFRDCAEIAQHGCKRDKVLMPAVRGSGSDKRAGLITQSH